MSIRLLYISNVEITGKFIPGVVEKIKGQLSAFRRNGYLADTLYPTNAGDLVREMNSGIIHKYKGARPFYVESGIIKKLSVYAKLAIFGHINFNNCLDDIVKERYNVIYLRFYMPGTDLVRFLRKVKKACPDILILLEYPTLNVGNLMGKDPVRKLIYHINKPRIKALNKIADFIITLTKDKTLFGKPAVFMTNGFDASRIRVVDPQVTADPFVITGVASDCAHYHGYDKVILGLAAYYGNNPKRKVFFRIISSLLGYNITVLKKLVDENNLNPYVEFCGSMDREGLEKEYKNAHVGMGTLALHRVGLMDNYSLKHREYAAFGLPFIMSKGDDVFENADFVLTLERDELPLDIFEILSFYDKLVTLYPDYPKAFRRFAEEKISWDTQLENVFRVISAHNSGNKITCA